MTFRRALVAAAVCAVAFCWVGAAFAASSNVVVSEFRFRGPSGASDEFVELYNLSPAAVDISGWKVNGSNNAGTTSTRATIPAGTLLGPGCHFLLTNSTAYSGAVAGDATFATGFTDDGGVALLSPASTLVDAVGLSAGSAYKEGTPLASLGTTNADKSYERKPGGSAGSGSDTDDNASDFQVLSPSQPQDQLSSCVGVAPAPTNPSGMGAASPASVAQGTQTLLTVSASPGTNPASTGLTVTGDLSQIGGPAAASFHDDGLAGDATAGDGTYSFQATVAASTAPGAKSLPFTVADAQSRGGSGSIPLTVTASGTPTLAGLVISQVYGGGGNSGATFTNDFIELFNPTSAAVDLGSASVQYASATGTAGWQVTNLSGTIQPHRYYLVQESQGAGGTTPLPAPDASGAIAMSGTAGKVALVANQTALSGACPPGPVDLVGFGTTANCSETAPAPAPSNTTADLRANGGCTDTNNNAADFTAGAPTPRNSASTANTCTGGTGNAPVTIACGSDVTTPQGTAASTQISATDPDGVVTSLTLGSVTPTPAQGSITLNSVTPAGTSGGTATGTLTADAQLPVGTYTVQLQAANNDSPPQTASCTLHVVVTGTLPIGTVQGSVPDTGDATTFDSPYLGQTVTVRGVVTELTFDSGSHGFYLQNSAATADSDPTTSDGIFVFMGSFTDLVNHYTPVVGDEVVLTGKVNEYFHQTELGSASATKVGTGAVTPFVADPPSDSAAAAVYWERHEGMQATVPTGSVVDSPTHFYSSTSDTEFYAIAPDAPVALRADPYARRAFRDAHPLDDQPGTFDNGNGYRILVTDEGVKVNDPNAELPPVHTFQTFSAPATGGVFFDFGKYSVSVATQPQVVDGVDPSQNDPPQVFDRSSAYSIANFNMENLYDYRDDPFDGCDFFGNPGCPGVSPPFDYPPASDAVYQERETEIAHQIVEDLHAPDVIVVAEAEDQDICTVQNWALVCGTTNNADGKADTVQELAVHIHAIGGPDYDVAYDRDGADARGIVCAFLYRTDRVQLIPASSTDAVLGSSPAVSYRGAPLAFDSDVSNPKALNAVLPADVDRSTGTDGSNVFTRAAQVAHFQVSPTVPGTPANIWVIANHFTSGPDADVGQRREQAAYNAALVRAIQSQEPQAKVMVAGDLNEYPRPDDPFPPPNTSDQLAPLYDAGLHDLYDSVLADHPSAAYSYVFEGQAQDLDHQFVTDSFFNGLQAVNEAHINSDYPLDTPGPDNRGTSDHDPMVSRWGLAVDHAPTVSAGGPYAVDEGGTTTLTATGSDPDGDTLTYAWDLNGDGTYETPGQSVTYSAADGPATKTVAVRATDPAGQSATSSATVTIRNVAPTATFNAPSSATVGTGFTLSLTNPHDPSGADTAAGFTYAFDCGDGAGYAAFGSASSRACPAPTTAGTRTVRGEIRDRDGGTTEYTRTVSVGVTYDAVCKLARAYSSKKVVANLVCVELAIAEAEAKHGQNRAAEAAVKLAEATVRAESGHAFTRDEANTLIALMQQL